VVYVLAIACTVFGWWFSTGIILWLNQLPVRTHRWTMGVFTLLLLAVLNRLSTTAEQVSVEASLVAFVEALLIWSWLEVGYLMGFVTGPGNRACPPDAAGWTRFSLALKTSLYHELAVVALVLLVIALSAGKPNQVAAQTCVVLWLMRWSAKLNLFLGVANFHAEWLPKAQRHLVSYMHQRRINLLFPFSVVLGTAAAIVFLLRATNADSGAVGAGNTIVALLLGLGVLEHWFLVLPIQDSRLWQWAMPREARTDAAGSRRIQAART
jgi:putative photosynthetic complex assembly protein 2